jgi:hypothetical protein
MTPVACSVCSKRDATYFRVERVAADGTASQLTTVCSVKCMSGWLYQYASIQSMRLVYGAKQAIDQIKGFFKP